MKIQLLCGPVASGKSTYSQNAAKTGVICLNDDALVNMFHGNIYTLYQPQLKLLYKSVENHIISTVLAKQGTILIDRGLNIGLESRKRFIALAKSFDTQIEAIVFEKEKPEIHAMRRFQSDARGHDFQYWLDVANYHEILYVVPSIEEGFDKVSFISYDQIQTGIVL
jgi:predicted kinase